MKLLSIPFLPSVDYRSSWHELNRILDEIPETIIGETPWADYPYLPQVTLRVGHTADSIALRFSVVEEVAQAKYRNTHDPVHKDSCVEFFVSFDNGDNYYNLEFNCVGTRMMAYGKNVVSERTKLPVELVESIRTHSTIDLGIPVGEQGQWDLQLLIPLSVFIHEDKLELTGKTVLGNFYKCGDDLPSPHFVTWNPVDFPTPSFHQPSSFGKLSFLSP